MNSSQFLFVVFNIVFIWLWICWWHRYVTGPQTLTTIQTNDRICIHYDLLYYIELLLWNIACISSLATVWVLLLRCCNVALFRLLHVPSVHPSIQCNIEMINNLCWWRYQIRCNWISRYLMKCTHIAFSPSLIVHQSQWRMIETTTATTHDTHTHTTKISHQNERTKNWAKLICLVNKWLGNQKGTQFRNKLIRKVLCTLRHIRHIFSVNMNWIQI